MTRKRAWEVGAGLLLLLTLLGMGGAAFYYRGLNQALAGALHASDLKAIARALRQGADPRTRGPEGETLLTVAARTGDTALLKEALAGDLDVNARDHYGLTPLMWAASTGGTATVRELLAAGADPSLRAYSGHTALGLALQVGKTHMKSHRTSPGLIFEKPRVHRFHRAVAAVLQQAGARQ